MALGWAAALITAAAFWRASGFDFITLDDLIYVTQNPTVTGGLSIEGIKSAFTRTSEFYWIPATWLSLMADAQFQGLGAEGFHRTNVILHALNALLLYLFLAKATKSPLQSFAATLLFALHPMRVESVAWVTSRKDLLSGFFILLSLISHLKWKEEGKNHNYWLSVAAMALGLMSKPIAVVVPFLMLAVDLWPLERKEPLAQRIWEKAPHFALFAGFSALTIYTQADSVISLRSNPAFARLEDTVTAFVNYLYKTIWPLNLALENRIDTSRITGFWAIAGLAALLALTIALWRLKDRAAPLFAGWLWFAAALAPVCGIITVGVNLVADRFTYLPHMGLFAGLLFFAHGQFRWPSRAKRKFAIAVAAAVAALAAATIWHLPHWKDSETLYSWNAKVTGGNSLSLKLLGDLYLTTNRHQQAYDALLAASLKDREDADVLNKMALAAWQLGMHRETLKGFTRALALKPDYWVLHYNTGLYFKDTGYLEGATRELAEAARLNPSNSAILVDLAKARKALGDVDGAIKAYREAEKTMTDPETQFELATLLAKSGRTREALDYFENILKAHPDHVATMINIAITLENAGDAKGASEWLLRAKALSPESREISEALNRLGSR